MLRIDILSVAPSLMGSFFEHSIVKRAQDKELVHIELHDIRDYTLDKHGAVDDYPFGGGAGMVLSIEPIHRCIDHLKSLRSYDEVVYLTPDGEQLSQQVANTLSTNKSLILLCGHYKGVDERIRQHFVTKEISIGDYVLSGGELPAAVLTDALVRLVPGVLGNETSALTDSFQDGLLAPPVYTRPARYGTWEVPDVLLSGHQAKIDSWRHEKAVERTRTRRPDLLDED